MKAEAEPGAAVAAPDEMTDEQIWDELNGAEPKENEADTTEAEAGETPPDAGADADPKPSEDGKDETAANTDGKEPEDLQAQIARLEHERKSDLGRLKWQAREIETLRAKIASAEKSAPATDDDDPDRKARQDKLAKAREEYGDIIGPMADQIADLEARFTNLSSRERQDLTAQKAQLKSLADAQEQVFLGEHPDGFDTIVNHRKAFDAWVDDQPRRIRDIYAANTDAIVDGTGSALLVGMFKQALGAADSQAPAKPDKQQKIDTRRQRQIDGAQSTRTGTTQPSSAAPAKDSEDAQAHWNYWEAKDAKHG